MLSDYFRRWLSHSEFLCMRWFQKVFHQSLSVGPLPRTFDDPRKKGRKILKKVFFHISSVLFTHSGLVPCCSGEFCSSHPCVIYTLGMRQIINKQNGWCKRSGKGSESWRGNKRLHLIFKSLFCRCSNWFPLTPDRSLLREMGIVKLEIN